MLSHRGRHPAQAKRGRSANQMDPHINALSFHKHKKPFHTATELSRLCIVGIWQLFTLNTKKKKNKKKTKRNSGSCKDFSWSSRLAKTRLVSLACSQIQILFFKKPPKTKLASFKSKTQDPPETRENPQQLRTQTPNKTPQGKTPKNSGHKPQTKPETRGLTRAGGEGVAGGK